MYSLPSQLLSAMQNSSLPSSLIPVLSVSLPDRRSHQRKMSSFRVWLSSDFNCIAYVLVIIVLTLVIIGCTTVNLLMNGRWRLFGMPFRVRDTERPATIGVLKARNLSFELKTVANWCLLGINLGVPIHELSRIEQTYRGSERQKLQMLDLWLQRSHAPSWREVVNALELMGEIRVAERIQQKYIRGECKG